MDKNGSYLVKLVLKRTVHYCTILSTEATVPYSGPYFGEDIPLYSKPCIGLAYGTSNLRGTCSFSPWQVGGQNLWQFPLYINSPTESLGVPFFGDIIIHSVLQHIGNITCSYIFWIRCTWLYWEHHNLGNIWQHGMHMYAQPSALETGFSRMGTWRVSNCFVFFHMG